MGETERRKSYELLEYKDAIMRKLLRDEKVLALFGVTDPAQAADLIRTKIYPYEKIPDVKDDTGDKMICFDLTSTFNEKKGTFRDVVITFYISAPEYDLYRDDGLWYDLVACEIDRLFSGSYELGLGPMRFLSIEPYYPERNWYGRRMRFGVYEFGNTQKYGGAQY